MSIDRKVCWICLELRDVDQIEGIYDGNGVLAKKLSILTGTKIPENQTAKKAHICLICTTKLCVAIDFRNKCLRSEIFFEKFATPNDSVLVIKENEQEHQVTIEEETNVHEDESNPKGSRLSPMRIVSNRPSESTGSIKESIIADPVTQNVDHKNAVHCNLCLKSFTTLNSYKNHQRTVHQELNETDLFKCPHCERLFKMKYYLNRHVKNTHKNAATTDQKEKQLTQKTEDEIFKEKLTGGTCPYCKKYLTSRHSLNDHIRVKHELIDYSKRFFCDLCGKDFPLKYYILRHIKASHLRTLSYKKKNTENLPCSICGKILKSKGNLTTHEKTHRTLTADEYWYCDLCGNKFKGRGEMSVHIKKRHLFKIKYPCPKCPGKTWRTLFQLQRHVKVFHENIREFKCEWCGKDFGEKNKLICHTRIHTGEQPFLCSWPDCDRKFTHQTDLRRHYWGHTGERPYRCKVPSCLKGFMKKSELIAHSNRCHPQSKALLSNSMQLDLMS